MRTRQEVNNNAVNCVVTSSNTVRRRIQFGSLRDLPRASNGLVPNLWQEDPRMRFKHVSRNKHGHRHARADTRAAASLVVPLDVFGGKAEMSLDYGLDPQHTVQTTC